MFDAEVGPALDHTTAAHFLGQVLHESLMLTRLEENLRYSARRLMEVWPLRFPTLEIAQQYAGNGPKLAEKVYTGRLGNTESGDGWKYRGRGLIMVTGRKNYTALAALTGLDLVNSPDLLAQRGPALRASLLWFQNNASRRIPDGVAAVTQAVNGGLTGLADRERLTALALTALTAEPKD